MPVEDIIQSHNENLARIAADFKQEKTIRGLPPNYESLQMLNKPELGSHSLAKERREEIKKIISSRERVNLMLARRKTIGGLMGRLSKGLYKAYKAAAAAKKPNKAQKMVKAQAQIVYEKKMVSDMRKYPSKAY